MHGSGFHPDPKTEIGKQTFQKFGLRCKRGANPQSLIRRQIARVLEMVDEVSDSQAMHQVIPRPDRISVNEGNNG